jgi:hypothetical protein
MARAIAFCRVISVAPYTRTCSSSPDHQPSVAFATYGDYSFTAWGFVLTLTGAILASLKTIIT